MEHRTPLPGDGLQITLEQKAEVLRRMNRRRGLGGLFWEWAKTFIIAVALFLVVRAFLFEAFKIPSGSMENTLLVGDFLFVNKAAYGAQVPFTRFRLPALQAPQRGDVVVFYSPHDGQRLVKRVIGLPGDRIALQGGRVYINGELAKVRPDGVGDAEDDGGTYIKAPRYLETLPGGRSHEIFKMRPEAMLDNMPEIVVPSGHLFVMGDNRDNSADSRFIGTIERRRIVGRALAVAFSLDRNHWFVPRLSRFFTKLN
jgi:signal peptidase I